MPHVDHTLYAVQVITGLRYVYLEFTCTGCQLKNFILELANESFNCKRKERYREINEERIHSIDLSEWLLFPSANELHGLKWEPR